MKQLTLWEEPVISEPPVPAAESIRPAKKKPAGHQVREVAVWNPTVNDLPPGERPVSRMSNYGPRALSTTELLAILLGGPYQLQTARDLVVEYKGLPALAQANGLELQQRPGIGATTVARIQAAFELGRRLLSDHTDDDKPQIRTPADAANLLMPEMSLLEQEHLRVILLDTKNRVLGTPTIYVGSLNTSLIRVGELFRNAIRANCAAVIVCHNHPSGDVSPSPEDVAVTRQIVEAGKLLDIELLDHIIVGHGGRFASLKERGLGFS